MDTFEMFDQCRVEEGMRGIPDYIVAYHRCPEERVGHSCHSDKHGNHDWPFTATYCNLESRYGSCI